MNFKKIYESTNEDIFDELDEIIRFYQVNVLPDRVHDEDAKYGFYKLARAIKNRDLDEVRFVNQEYHIVEMENQIWDVLKKAGIEPYYGD